MRVDVWQIGRSAMLLAFVEEGEVLFLGKMVGVCCENGLD